MWESKELGDENLLWSCIAFMGGIAGRQQAPCGVVSSSAVFLGLRHRCSLEDKAKAKEARIKIREQASELVNGFEKEFGTIICRELISFDTSDPEEYRKFRESGIWRQKCNKAIEYAIDKLYDFEELKN
ncbi:MAG: C_GCAxxG_C_C family protein [Desulfobacteraceae bacterium]|jgi:C_GCAxxG_C_C family probable redox protein|nr:MAG: C_GCAxxG_C_C family protein [Desulfobacteraceae bacterium]